MTFVWRLIAAFAEIAGCFAFWAWARLDRSPLWLVPGMISLALFAWVLERADSALAGRAYAAYGGVYIMSSMLWLWLVEGHRPDRWDGVVPRRCSTNSPATEKLTRDRLPAMRGLTQSATADLSNIDNESGR